MSSNINRLFLGPNSEVIISDNFVDFGHSSIDLSNCSNINFGPYAFGPTGPAGPAGPAGLDGLDGLNILINDICNFTFTASTASSITSIFINQKISINVPDTNSRYLITATCVIDNSTNTDIYLSLFKSKNEHFSNEVYNLSNDISGSTISSTDINSYLWKLSNNSTNVFMQVIDNKNITSGIWYYAVGINPLVANIDYKIRLFYIKIQ